MRGFRDAVPAALSLILIAQSAGATQVDADDSRLPSAPLNETVLTMAGDPMRPPVGLEVTLFTPLGPGPFPLAVLNHGATLASTKNRGERYRFTISAYYFLSRGYAVALPMMRGFANSGGEMRHLGCDLATLGDANAHDIRAVIEGLARRHEIDTSRIVVGGQSFGGWNTLALGPIAPAAVKGLIAFNAAIRSSDCGDQDGALIRSAGRFGATTRLPSLWFYGDNDTIMPTATWHAVFDGYRAAGANAELVAIGRFGSDSHEFLGDPHSLPLWAPKVDAFLTRIGMPSAVVFPQYLPQTAPPASNFAALDNVDAVPFLNEAGRTAYRRFLARPEPRAFVIAPNGSASQTDGGYDPIGFSLRACARIADGCALYAADHAVVWTGRPGNGVPRYLVRKAKPGALLPLVAFFSLNPDCTPRGEPKVTIAQAPGHGTITISQRDVPGRFPPNGPLAGCNGKPQPATAVGYLPADGFTGLDAVMIDEVKPDGQQQTLRFELNVTGEPTAANNSPH